MAKLLQEEEEGDESFYTEQFGEEIFRDEDSEFTSSEEGIIIIIRRKSH